MNEELEPEVLSYREFRNRQTLLEWERRRRAFESQRGKRGAGRGDEVPNPLLRSPLPMAPPPR